MEAGPPETSATEIAEAIARARALRNESLRRALAALGRWCLRTLTPRERSRT
jgi:hypothetical protein